MIFLLFISGGSVQAQMSSTNYEIRFDALGSGGEDTSSSASYILRDTLGNISGEGDSSTSYELNSGFRPGIFDPSVDFTIFIQDRSSQVAATVLVGTTVTVTSAAGIAAGDMIVVVQDEGSTQVSAIGVVDSTTATTATVDVFTNSGAAPVIDGANDVVYVLDAATVSLGTLSDTLVTTGIIAWEVNSDVDDGYDVFVLDDGNLRSGANTITDVADGTVTAGSSEYGARSSDSTLATSTFDTADTAFTTTAALVGSRDDVEFKSRDFLTMKMSITDTQEEGTYAHALTLIYVGDY